MYWACTCTSVFTCTCLSPTTLHYHIRSPLAGSRTCSQTSNPEVASRLVLCARPFPHASERRGLVRETTSCRTAVTCNQCTFICTVYMYMYMLECVYMYVCVINWLTVTGLLFPFSCPQSSWFLTRPVILMGVGKMIS